MAFGDLPEVVFSLSLFVFGVDEAFGVEELLFYIFEMFLEDFFAFEVAGVLFTDAFDIAFFLADLGISYKGTSWLIFLF